MATIKYMNIAANDYKEINTKRKRDEIIQKIDSDEKEDLPMSHLLKEPDFNAGFLAAKNPHPLDRTIRFVESSHTYFVNFEFGKFISDHVMSTSALVHSYFSDFDPDKIISKMGPKSRNSSKYRGMSSEQIKKMWTDSGTKASSEGTKFHFLLECVWNNMSLEPFANYKVIKQYMKWKSEVLDPLNVVAFRSEQRMRTGLEHRITGSADQLFVYKNQDMNSNVLKILIVDWKFSKKITRSSFFGSGIGVCGVLDDCNYSHYLLQQNIYKHMLEKYYGNWTYNGKTFEKIEIAGMHLAVFHDTRTTYESIILPDVQEIVLDMMADRKEQLAKIMAGDINAQLVPIENAVKLANVESDERNMVFSGVQDDEDDEIVPLTKS
jgi:hypothetical protein